jgi:hypothetical protein
MVSKSVLRHGDAVAEELTPLIERLDLLLAGQASLAEQQAQALRLLADAEPVDPDRLYSRADAARLLDVHTRTIDRWIKSGVLARANRGRRTYITGRSLRERHHVRAQSSAVEVLKL